ncbi:hypothetical protein BDQ12DRAFT_717895 [Crucibulum laeve]|uniref:WW domain-containing protein n=1 Tax=Crucibulum laeve TaxID=68775 RepID=A0A5C3MJ72_9AGAR|nr:hypothetical protein BDQ12DRAFT_717895 [Crucibulum laeve]
MIKARFHGLLLRFLICRPSGFLGWLSVNIRLLWLAMRHMGKGYIARVPRLLYAFLGHKTKPSRPSASIRAIGEENAPAISYMYNAVPNTFAPSMVPSHPVIQPMMSSEAVYPESLFERSSSKYSPHSENSNDSENTLNDASAQDISVDNLGHITVHPSASSLHLLPAAVSSLGTNCVIGSQDEVSSRIYPMMPSQSLETRYARERIIGKESARYKLRPLQDNFSPGHLAEGWVEYIHPEGQPFFFHKEKRIVTDTWLWDDELSEEVMKCIDQIEDYIRARNVFIPEDTNLFLDVKKASDDNYWCAYYFARHSTRSLFWLESYQLNQFVNELRGGEISPSHIKLFLESEYWTHWEAYPNIIAPTAEALDIVAGTINDAQTVPEDVLTSELTCVNHSYEELERMSAIITNSRRIFEHGGTPSSWFIGRFMKMIYRDRVLNYFGQYGVRLSRKQSIHGAEKPKHTWLIKILSPVLFCSPDVHLTTMEGLWVDRLTIKPNWSEFFRKLNEEWIGHTVNASILLNANVAFLAIPSNDNGNGGPSSVVQILSYLSIVTSITSIMLGLLLVRQHKTRERGTVEEVAQFLKKRDHCTRGLETLAIMYSLPYALLIWSIVTFLSAFSAMCFRNDSVWTPSVVGIAWVLMAVLVAWCVRMSWEEKDDRWWSMCISACNRVIEPSRRLLASIRRAEEVDNSEERVQDEKSSRSRSSLDASSTKNSDIDTHCSSTPKSSQSKRGFWSKITGRSLERTPSGKSSV